MRPAPRTLVLAATAPLLLAAACTGSPAVTAPLSPGPAISVTSTAEPTSGSPTASAGPSATACPSGEYRVVSFTTGSSGAAGKGSGGDIGVEFTNGRYEVDFDDDEPISIKTEDGSGQLIVDGSIAGTYSGSSDALTFAVTTSSGKATTKLGGKTSTLTMTQVASLLGLTGKGSATCASDRLTLESGSTTIELVQD